MNLAHLKTEIMEATELAALAVLRLQNPAFDEVKLKEAYKIAGSERWLKYHIKQGNIKPIRRGNAKNSPIYFSRLEIAALKKAENNAKAIFINP
ncbi:MAG: hypothetical protein FDW93_06415 [Bergeyella sp.]|nr:hypothetical protein [Bergeyella sp.]